MATYLFTWNPTKWDWETLEEDSASYRRRGFVDGRWSCGVTKRIVPGDRVFLIKLGPHKPTGIMASGFAVSSPFQAPHYSDASKTANYIDLRYDILLNPSDEKLLDRDILEVELPEVRWSPQGSGITIPPDAAARLEEMWSEQITSIGLSPSKSPDEIVAPERYWEGAVRRIAVDAYERDPRARRACLKHHGLTCCVCGFDFAVAYGDLGKGFIHVHHLKQLSDIGSEYEVDPITDLVPVCPNCHAMLHKRNPPMAPEDLRITMKKANKTVVATAGNVPLSLRSDSPISAVPHL